MIKKRLLLSLFCTIYFFGLFSECAAQSIKFRNDIKEKIIVFGNEKMTVTVDYNKKANISLLVINSQPVIQGNAGIYSMIRTKGATYSTLHLSSDPVIKASDNIIHIVGIKYGDTGLSINESWTFTITNSNIKFDIDRTMSRATIAEQVALPVFTFNSMDTWEGAYQDYGGLAWFYLFNKKLDTYGVHSNSSRFFNSKTSNGFTISVSASGKQVAMDYSRTTDDKMACVIAVSQVEMQPRFDSGTHRRRFVRDTTDVWAPFKMSAGKSRESITLSYFNYKEKFDRGNFVGING
jgi:hypothetical protein